MNDLSTLLIKLLPAVVIGTLLAIFYLLDIFSVRPGVESPPTPRVIAEETSKRAATSSAPPSPAARPVESSPPVPTAVASPVSPTVQPSGFPAPDSPHPIEPARMNSASQYLPPPGAGMPQPLASDNAPTEAPRQLPTHEIIQEDGERIDEETRRAVQQPEAPSPSGGGDG
jgi:hypothetical protein